jgi:hypothetical protein
LLEDYFRQLSEISFPILQKQDGENSPNYILNKEELLIPTLWHMHCSIPLVKGGKYTAVDIATVEVDSKVKRTRRIAINESRQTC